MAQAFRIGSRSPVTTVLIQRRVTSRANVSIRSRSAFMNLPRAFSTDHGCIRVMHVRGRAVSKAGIRGRDEPTKNYLVTYGIRDVTNFTGNTT